MNADMEGVTLAQKHDRIRAIIDEHGIDYFNDEYRLMFEKLVIPNKQSRGAFVHDNNIYYADDCSLVQCMGFK